MDKSKFYKYGLYFIIIVLINLVGMNIFLRIDLTQNKLYSLSKASIESVSTLKEPLTINVFFSKNLTAPYNNVERYLHDLLEEYEINSNDYMSYRFYNVNAKEGDLSEKAEENRKLAQSFGIHPVNIQSIEQDEAKVQRAYMGMVFIHGNVVEKLPAVTSTEGLEYKITTTIKKMNNKISALLNLQDKIKVILLQSSSLISISDLMGLSGLQELKQNLKGVVDKLNKKTYDRLEFITIDPSVESVDAEFLNRFGRYFLQWNEIKTKSGSGIPAGKGVLAMGLEFKGKFMEIQLLKKGISLTSRGLEEKYSIPEIKTIETFIDENIDNLIDINDDLGYLTSNGTLSLSPSLPPQYQMMMQQNQESLKNFNSLMSNNYTVKQINLKDEEIPESIDTLIIAGAKENFNDWQLFQIDQFLMKGKSLAVFIDTFREIKQQKQQYGFNQPVFMPINTGLEKILSHYGLNISKSYVMDENCYINKGDINMSEMPIYYAPIITNEKINHQPDFMKNIKQMIMVKISPVNSDLEKIKNNSLKITKLFSSSEKSWEMKGRINLMPMFIKPPEKSEDKKSFSLAYLLEGEFPSYFADKPIPEKPKKDEKTDETAEKGKVIGKEKEEVEVIRQTQLKGHKEIIVKSRPGKIFLIGSTELLKDNVLDQNGHSPNAVFVLNTIDYLNNKEDVAVMRSKNQRFNPLKETGGFIKTVVKIVNIGGLPAMFVFLGFFLFFKRRIRKLKIKALFNKEK